MNCISTLLVLVVLAVTTPAEAGLASIPVGTAGYHVEGTVGPNVVAGDATYDATTKVMSYFGRVADPNGERWVSLTARVSGWKTVEGATWLFDDVKATIYVNSVAYPVVGSVPFVGGAVGGELVADGFQAGLVDLVTLYARGTAARFTSSGGGFPTISGFELGPVAFTFTNARGERFVGQIGTDAFVTWPTAGWQLQMPPFTSWIRGTWATAKGIVDVDATFVVNRTYDDKLHIVVDGFHVWVDFAMRAFPDAFRVRASSADDMATRLVRLVLVASQTAM